jgi:hypothetical protein
MGSYRCLNCNRTTGDVNLAAERCSNVGCGFVVGRYVYDEDEPSDSSGVGFLGDFIEFVPLLLLIGAVVAAGVWSR